MTETLYIRLGSLKQDIIHWLVWSELNNEIIASGELNGAEELQHLTEQAKTRSIVTFVSSSDVILKQLKVPGKSQRAIRLAAPYMLEDFLAQEVEQLFFAYTKSQNDQTNDNCYLAVVERAQLEQWQHWLKEAGLTCKTMIPEVLALPLPKNNTVWTAITLGEQILIRQGIWQGLVVDKLNWSLLAQSISAVLPQSDSENNEKSEPKITIESYSALESNCFSINAMPAELPLALLAENIGSSPFNLLQGEYQVKQKRSPIWENWSTAAVITVVALLLTIAIKTTKLHQMTVQQNSVETKILNIYKKAFPKTRRVKITTVRSQLKRKLAQLNASSGDGNFLAMLVKLQPAFATVPQLQTNTLKYDSKRQEIRIQATASGYQYFEQFKNKLEKAHFKVTQGALNNQDQQISGSFSIKEYSA